MSVVYRSVSHANAFAIGDHDGRDRFDTIEPVVDRRTAGLCQYVGIGNLYSIVRAEDVLTQPLDVASGWFACLPVTKLCVHPERR